MAKPPPERRRTLVALTATLVVFAVAGIPLLAYLWETLNQVASGQVPAPRVLISVPIAVIFGLVLFALARAIQGWERTRRS